MDPFSKYSQVQGKNLSNQPSTLDQYQAPRSAFDKYLTKEEPTNPFTALFSGTIDLLSRGNYASARFADGLANRSEGILNTLYSAGKELVAPEERLSYSDVIKRYDPEFAKNHPYATSTLGFIGDVALDPTTYLGVGLFGDGIKVGGKILSKTARTVIDDSIKLLATDAIDAGKFIKGSAEVEQLIAKRTQDIAQVGKSLGLDTNAAFLEQANKIAKLETLGDLQKASALESDSLRQFGASELKQRAEERISYLMDLNPQLAKEFTAPRKIGINVYPLTSFTEKGKIRVGEGVLDILGVNKLADKVSSLKNLQPFEKLAGLFNRDYKLPQVFIDLRTGLEDSLNFANANAQDEVTRLYRSIDKEGRTNISNAFNEIRDRLSKIADQDGNVKLADAIAEQRQVLSTLKPEERAVITNLQQTYKKYSEIEKRADLLENSIKRLNGDYFDIIADGNKYRNLKNISNLDQLAEFPSAEVDKLSNMINVGATPDLDAFSLLAQKITDSQQRVAIKNFNDSAEIIFGDKLNKLPRKYIDDLKYVGDGQYSRGLSESSENILKLYDKLISPFKFASTVGRVAFGPKQLLFGNPNQVAAELGLKAYRTLNPAAYIPAGLIGLTKKVFPDKNPAFIESLFKKGAATTEDVFYASRLGVKNALKENELNNFLDNNFITSAAGQKYSLREVDNLANQFGIANSFNELGDRIALKSGREVQQGLIQKGKDLISEPLKVIASIPGQIENYNRRALFINGLLMDYSPREAANMVNRALFDYGKGLSQFENNVVKRLIPFYCVPDTTLALTKDGWKSPYELKVGEEILTYNKELNKNEWKPCLDIAIFDYNQDITVLENSDHKIRCTDNHRWITQRVVTKRNSETSYDLEKPKIIETNELHGGHKILVAAEVLDNTDSILTPEQARLLGWLLTDGYWRWRGNHCEAMIYQSPKKFLDEVIEVAGGKPRKPHPDTGVVCVPVLRERVKQIEQYLEKDEPRGGYAVKGSNLISIITRLNREAMEALYEAMYLADGTVSNSKTSDFFAAEIEGVREGFQVLCTLLGKRVATNHCNGEIRGLAISKSKHIRVQNLDISTEHYSGKVWCPKTENETWIMKQDRLITITGNTYEKFAVPLALRTAREKPGILVAPYKVYDLVSKLSSGQELSEQERNLLPDYLIEQPSIFRGFDPNGKAVFNVLGGTTLPEILSLIETDKDGNINYQKTVENTVLAQLTPFLKVPIELAIGKNFFTGAATGKDATAPSISLGKLPKGINETIETLNANLPDMVKDAIGWETKTDRNGNTKTYVNGYLAYTVMNYLPALKQFIRPLDTDKSNLEAAMELILGTNIQKIDLKEQSQIQLIKYKQEINSIKSGLRKSIREQNKSKVEDYQEQLRDLLNKQ